MAARIAPPPGAGAAAVLDPAAAGRPPRPTWYRGSTPQGRRQPAYALELVLGRRTHHRPLCTWKHPAAGLGDGNPLRFRFELPEGLCPGFDRGTYALEWYLEARVTIPWSRDPRVWIPLAASAALALDDGDAPAPLAVGTERVDLPWRSLAEQSGLTFDGGAIVGRAGDAALRIAREPRGRRGTIVGARVDLPDLGLGLELHGGRLRGRDPAQVTWLEGQLGDLLTRRPPTAVSDRGLALELDDPGQVAAALRPFIDDVKALALLLDACRDRAPPPTAMSAHVAAWERAAAHLGGRLRRGPMAIVGRSDDLDVELRSEWDEHGRPIRAVLEARTPAAVDGRHHLRWEARSGGPPSSELPLAGLWPGARALEIDEAGVRVILDGPLADPLRELGRIAALIELSGRLQGRRGAYR